MEFNDYNNPQVAALPAYLKQYIVPQYYERYSAIDQAVWRYVMRQNFRYLKQVAYYPYIKGLQKAGLSIENIPNLQVMNDHLGTFGWAAVTVDGFIPPAVFMEFQAYKVLVIAADIRQLNHIEYTPAPDIIHESAGHAPIIAEPDYNQYLSYFGHIGTKALFSDKDFELYEAIRRLSILKEIADAKQEEIDEASLYLQTCSENMGAPSEMALLSRLHWWSVEYGLIGTLEDPKIYGAGLLSSIAESVTCMQADVKKLWYQDDTVNYPYDITKPQPQLFVTPSFQNLIDVLERFADKMAFRVGGKESVAKAILCKRACTAVYSSGLQLTGVFDSFELDEEAQMSYIKTKGPTALSFEDKELEGQGKSAHLDGFSSPIGKLKYAEKALEDYNLTELESQGIIISHKVSLEFESGIALEGKVVQIHRTQNKNILITFSDCTVKNKAGCILFEPSWGRYDMAIGATIISVFNGAADKSAFESLTHVSEPKRNENLSVHQEQKDLIDLYQQVRMERHQKQKMDMMAIFSQIQHRFSDDWLLSLEILELLVQRKENELLQKKIYEYLTAFKIQKPSYCKLIEDGLLGLDVELAL